VRHRLRQQMPNAYSLKLDALPMDEDALKHTSPGEWAQVAAMSYKTWMLQANPKRRFAKNALQRFAFVLQGIRDKRCNGSTERMSKIMVFAFASPKYRKEVLRGPHRLTHHWRSIVADMEKGQQ
jgi:hypothetical protein